jgi:hypothetical protein
MRFHRSFLIVKIQFIIVDFDFKAFICQNIQLLSSISMSCSCSIAFSCNHFLTTQSYRFFYHHQNSLHATSNKKQKKIFFPDPAICFKRLIQQKTDSLSDKESESRMETKIGKGCIYWYKLLTQFQTKPYINT